MIGDARKRCRGAGGQRDLDRRAADRAHLARSAARQHADIGMAADQDDALGLSASGSTPPWFFSSTIPASAARCATSACCLGRGSAARSPPPDCHTGRSRSVRSGCAHHLVEPRHRHLARLDIAASAARRRRCAVEFLPRLLVEPALAALAVECTAPQSLITQPGSPSRASAHGSAGSRSRTHSRH
jgi:hypothetical protein